MDKIVIIGSPGAGKSTFARALGELLHIEVFHLDRHFWQPGWQELPRHTRIQIEQDLVKDKNRWIIEGTYLGSSDQRLTAADTIIFLDMPRLLCLWRIIKRHVETHDQQGRPDIPDGCTDKLSPRCVLKVLAFPHRGRKHLMEKMHDFNILMFRYRGRRQIVKKMGSINTSATGQLEQKKIHIIRSASALEIFLHQLSAQDQEKPAQKSNIVCRNGFPTLAASVLGYPRHFWSLCSSITHNIRQSPLIAGKSLTIEPFEHSAGTRTN